MNVTLPQLVHQNPFDGPLWPEKMIWTASSLKLFRTCKRKWFWNKILRLRTRYIDKNLMIGSAFHNTLGDWYKGSRSNISTIAAKYAKEMEEKAGKATAYYDQDELDKMHVLIDTFRGMMSGYGAVYDEDRQNWQINRASIEKEFVVDFGDFLFAGKTDLVAQGKGKQRSVLFEHKTASKIEASYIERLPLDTQIRGYIYGAKKGQLGISVNEVLYDVVKKCKLRRKSNESIEDFTQRISEDYESEPDKYFFRELLKFNKSNLDCFEYELRQTHEEYLLLSKELGDRPTLKAVSEIFGDSDALISTSRNDPRHWLPNDGACYNYFKQCEYHSLCMQGLAMDTALMYEQGDTLHDELSIEEE